MNARELVQRIVEAVASGDSDAAAALYAEEATLYHPLFPEPARGRAATARPSRSCSTPSQTSRRKR